MADILETSLCDAFSSMKVCISIKILPKTQTESKSALFQVCRRAGYNLPDPMLTQICDAIWRHSCDRLLLSLQWRHNGCNGVSNYRRFDCLLNRLFRRRSKKTSKLRVTGLCEGNPPVTDGFPSQRASNAENVCIWWRHHVNVDSKHHSVIFMYSYFLYADPEHYSVGMNPFLFSALEIQTKHPMF